MAGLAYADKLPVRFSVSADVFIRKRKIRSIFYVVYVVYQVCAAIPSALFANLALVAVPPQYFIPLLQPSGGDVEQMSVSGIYQVF